MRFLAIVVFLPVMFLSSAYAHDSAYRCQGRCFFDQGRGEESKVVVTEAPDAETAMDALAMGCNKLDKNSQGRVEPILPKNNPTLEDFCKFTWH